MEVSKVTKDLATILMLSAIVNGYVVSKFAPRVGTALTLGSYFGAGIVSLIGIPLIIKKGMSN
jgi:hypothetical protein